MRHIPIYARWAGCKPTAHNGYHLYVTVEFSHGIVKLEANIEIIYKCTDYCAADAEGAVSWRSCSHDWLLSDQPILSDKDQDAWNLSNFDSPFACGQNS